MKALTEGDSVRSLCAVKSALKSGLGDTCDFMASRVGNTAERIIQGQDIGERA